MNKVYSSVVYLKCLTAFFVYNFKARTQSKDFDMN